jgi:hypothetical protein
VISRRSSRFVVQALACKGAVLFGALLASRPALACAVCFGKSDSAIAKGMNMGMLTLLICITGVLATLATFFVFLAVRSSKHPQRDAMEASLNSSQNPAHS